MQSWYYPYYTEDNFPHRHILTILADTFLKNQTKPSLTIELKQAGLIKIKLL